MAKTMYEDMMSILTEYSSGLGEKMSAEAERLTKRARKQLKETSPRSREKGEHYADFWRLKRFGKKGTFRIVIYESHESKYRLTHLLEKGHKTRGDTFAEGRPHIEPVQERINKEFETAVERLIKEG